MPGDITLRNGAKPILHHRWKGGGGQRPHQGRVLAKTDGGAHPYVTWAMASDGGEVWDCYHGHYCGRRPRRSSPRCGKDVGEMYR